MPGRVALLRRQHVVPYITRLQIADTAAACSLLLPAPAPAVAMPAKKIAVWFFKGGVGKTTTAVNIAAELARPDGPNQRVALLDFDGQCNVTSMLIPPPTYSSSDDEDEVQVAEYNGDANEPSVHYVRGRLRHCRNPFSLAGESIVLQFTQR